MGSGRLREADRLTSIGTRAQIHEALPDYDGAAKALLKAVLAQYDGNVDGAIRILRHQLRVAAAAERPWFAEILAPICIMRHDADALAPLVDLLQASGRLASARAFDALAAIERADRPAAERHAAAAAAALADETDDGTRGRVLQRLARVAFYLHAYDRALDLSLSSAAVALQIGAWRIAAAAYSIAYAVHHGVTGDAGEADRFAGLWRDAAIRTGDESFIQSALVAEYGLAVSFADEARIEILDRLLRTRLLPQQYVERYPLALSHAIARGRTDAIAMRTLLQVLRDTPDRSRGEWSLCTALIAVADAAVADDASARANVRAALARLGRPRASDPAYEHRYRRLARAALAATCVMIGDDTRADRMLTTNEARSGERVDRFAELVRAAKWGDLLPSMRGFGYVVRNAVDVRRAGSVPAGLTPAEFEVLRLLGNGWSAGKIATETQRSVNTVYNHTRSILAKLDATRASEAVAVARRRGLLM